jgi:hypothetical protein
VIVGYGGILRGRDSRRHPAAGVRRRRMPQERAVADAARRMSIDAAMESRSEHPDGSRHERCDEHDRDNQRELDGVDAAIAIDRNPRSRAARAPHFAHFHRHGLVDPSRMHAIDRHLGSSGPHRGGTSSSSPRGPTWSDCRGGLRSLQALVSFARARTVAAGGLAPSSSAVLAGIQKQPVTLGAAF